MKKLLTLACVLASTVALSACESTGSGYVDTQVPYTDERTAGHTPMKTEPVRRTEVRSAEPVFESTMMK